MKLGGKHFEGRKKVLGKKFEVYNFCLLGSKECGGRICEGLKIKLWLERIKKYEKTLF